MPRPSKGPRLYLRKARPDKGQRSVWVIRDGSKEVGTGCGPDRRGDAEQALAAYIQSKWTPALAADASGVSDPADVYVADVIAYYARGRAPKAADPSGVKARLNALLEFWAEHTLADIRRSTCEAYVAHRVRQPIKMAKDPRTARRVSDQGARRELEDLSAAIGFWNDEHPLTRRPKVIMPPKAEGSRDALTRSQAALLLLAAMGWHRDDEGRWKRRSRNARAQRDHIRRFILIGLYTGTRPGVIPKLLWSESPSSAWVDLDDGVIYRRGRQEREHRTKRRTLVRIPDRLLAHLKRWKRLDEAAMAARAARDQPVTNAVLHHGGKPIEGRIRGGYASCVKDARLDPAITPHWHRHTAATWLMERDVKPWDAAGFLGMTMKTLEDNYGHHRPGHQSSARKALG